MAINGQNGYMIICSKYGQANQEAAHLRLFLGICLYEVAPPVEDYPAVV